MTNEELKAKKAELAIKLEAAKLEKEVKAAEAELAREEIYSDPEKLAEANRRYQQLSPRLLKAQAEWEHLAEEIMELEGK